MTEALYWQWVTRSEPAQDQTSLAAQLRSKLQDLGNDELAAFDKWFGQQMRLCYRWDLWGAAYVVTGCDTDYGFAEFRCFLISLGRERFEAALADPDSLAELPAWPVMDEYAYPFVEDYDLIAGQLYEERTGHELPFVPSGQAKPAGKQFSNRPKDLRRQYPRLAAQFPF